MSNTVIRFVEAKCVAGRVIQCKIAAWLPRRKQERAPADHWTDGKQKTIIL